MSVHAVLDCPGFPRPHLTTMSATPASPIDSPNRAPNAQDALLHAGTARLTQGLSPGSIVGAYMDWLAHLASAPGKQQELHEKAVRKLTRLALFAAQAAAGGGRPCIDPLPQDQRFEHPDWQQWPFNLYYQAFLLAQQWLWNATSGVRGVTRHHEHVVTFMARQWLDMFSPSNFLPTNPEVLRKTLATGGTNLVTAKRWPVRSRSCTPRTWCGRAWSTTI